MKKTRDSGIELLRIIAIFMVIGVHLLDYGKYFETALQVDGIVQSSALLIRIFVRSAVNIFLIISGYFMAGQKFDLKKSYSRVLKTYLSIFFYSVVLSIIALAVGPQERLSLGITSSNTFIILKMLTPVSAQTWYFLSSYIFVMLLAPFVNIALTSITKKQYQVLLVISGFIMSIWLYLGSIDFFRYVANDYGHDGILAGKNVFSFLFMYVVGGYIGMHTNKNPKPKFRYLIFALASLLANYYIFTRLNDVLGYKYAVLPYANPFVIMVSVFMFMFFKDLHFKSKIVNAIGGATLGIYAISDFWLVRYWLWGIFDFSKIDCSNVFKNLALIFVAISIIVICCSVIEILRKRLFDITESAWKKHKKVKVK
ncbi:MAG: acyltransferase [Clostridia bacterium]|nr:acyltransferase [Clostridia bacterium]